VEGRNARRLIRSYSHASRRSAWRKKVKGAGAGRLAATRSDQPKLQRVPPAGEHHAGTWLIDEAEHALKRALKIDERSSVALMSLGVLAIHRYAYEAAEAYFEGLRNKARTLNPPLWSFGLPKNWRQPGPFHFGP
jgi:hypothetical protein